MNILKILFEFVNPNSIGIIGIVRIVFIAQIAHFPEVALVCSLVEDSNNFIKQCTQHLPINLLLHEQGIVARRVIVTIENRFINESI
mgnify:FL=1